MSQLSRARRWWRSVATPGFADRGGVAVLVAVLLAGGVLLGMAALSVDVGQLKAEREQLISAADGAAQKVAITCGKSPSSCSTSTNFAAVQTSAQTIADANGNDGLNDVTLICGSGGALAPCDPTKEPTNLTACLNSMPTDGIKFVEVHTATRTSKTSTLLPTAFAASFVPGYNGATVGACSRVAWGTPGGGLSLTFSQCEWQASVLAADGTLDYADPANPQPSDERVITIHKSNSPTCVLSTSGQDAPGGFGWLDSDPASAGTGPCFTSVDVGGTVTSDTGNNVTKDCQDEVEALQQSRTVVGLPIYSQVTGNGNGGKNGVTYTISGIASFVITGYFFSNGNGNGGSANSWLTGNQPCKTGDTCISGFFVNGIVDSTSIQAGDNLFGATAVKTIG